MASVVVDVQQNATGLAKDAEAAAKGMAKIAAQEERLAKLSAADRALGVGRDPKKLAQALKVGDAIAKAEENAVKKSAAAALKVKDSAEKAQAKALKDHVARVNKTEKAERDRLNKLKQGQAKAITDSKRFAENFGKLKSGNLVGLGASFGSAGVAAGLAASAVLAVAVGAAVAAVGVTALTVKITSMALEARKARDESQGLVKVFAGGSADNVSRLSELLRKLGVDARVGEDQFVKLRKAGLSIGESASAIKLIADVTAKLGDKAGVETLEQVTNKASALKSALDGVKDPKIRAEKIKEYEAQLAKMAQQAGVAGDGIFALESKTTTARGALFRLNEIKTGALEKIGDKIAPSFDKLTSKVATMVEKFVSSEKGQKAIEKFGEVVSKILDKISAGIDFMVNHWDQISSAVQLVGAGVAFALAPAVVFVGALTAAVGILGASWVASTALMGAAVGAIGKVISFVDTTIKSAITYLVNAAPAFYQAGVDLVQGVINGVTGMAGRLLSSVSNLASGAVNKFKSVLGIHSPSTVMIAAGEDTAQGVVEGQENRLPNVEQAAQKVANAAIEPFTMPAINAPSLGSDTGPVVGGGSSSPKDSRSPGLGGQVPPMNFYFNIPAEAASDPDALMRSARREFEAAMRNYFLSMGTE